MHDVSVAVIDFGSQFTRLILRRLEHIGVRAAVFSINDCIEKVAALKPKAIVLSGGPLSVITGQTDDVVAQYIALDLPILAICYGMQAVSRKFGGVVSCDGAREFGEVMVHIERDSNLFRGLPRSLRVWMSHCDTVEVPGYGFIVLARSENGHIVATSKDNIYCVQFHPEVTHTDHGTDIIRNFAVDIVGCPVDWKIEDVAQTLTSRVREQCAGSALAIAGVSGGVDSSVAAKIVHEAIGNRLRCVFVDNGLMREGEVAQVKTIFADLGIPLIYEDASDIFLDRLRGVTDPEQKRKIIGSSFIEVFERLAHDVGDVEFLVQGTLYPDVIESKSALGNVIKSHHNVGGLPERMRLKLVEPLRELFKDEVREIGLTIGMPRNVLYRHPFPGPGLAIRIIGDVTRERVAMLRRADALFIDAIKEAGIYDNMWQAFAVLMSINTVGVMGDGRSYDCVCALRAVESVDGMTANPSSLDSAFLQKVARRIVNGVPGIARVVYDITSKPPGAIEWE